MMDRISALLVALFFLQIIATAFASKSKTPESQVHASDEKARLNRARELLASGLVTEAVSQLRRLAQRYPASAEVHLVLGTALALVPQRSEALAEIRKAVEIDPASLLHTTR